MALKAIAQDTFKTEVLDHKGVVFVDFFAEWCGPCKFTTPIIEELSNDSTFKDVKFVAVDVDESQELSGQYNIFSIPTFIIFKDGAVANQLTGAHDKQAFIAEIKKVIGS